MKEIIAVIARSQFEYRIYIDQILAKEKVYSVRGNDVTIGNKIYTFVASPIRLRTIRKGKFIFYGNWKDRPDIRELLVEIDYKRQSKDFTE